MSVIAYNFFNQNLQQIIKRNKFRNDLFLLQRDGVISTFKCRIKFWNKKVVQMAAISIKYILCSDLHLSSLSFGLNPYFSFFLSRELYAFVFKRDYD